TLSPPGCSPSRPPRWWRRCPTSSSSRSSRAAGLLVRVDDTDLAAYLVHGAHHRERVVQWQQRALGQALADTPACLDGLDPQAVAVKAERLALAVTEAAQGEVLRMVEPGRHGDHAGAARYGGRGRADRGDAAGGCGARAGRVGHQDTGGLVD